MAYKIVDLDGLKTVKEHIPKPSTSTPLSNSATTGTIGSSLQYAKADHKHPVQNLSLSLNGSTSTYNTSSTASKTWYAPTTAGTAGYELISNGSGAPIWKALNYAECGTPGSTQTKIVSISNFKLVKGTTVTIKFTHAHTSTNQAMLNVNSTGAKWLMTSDHTNSNGYTGITNKNSWANGEIVTFVYDGTNWFKLYSNFNKNPYILVAASDAPQWIKESADYVCDGVNDQEEINSALKRASDLSMAVQLSGGTFWLTGSIFLGSGNRKIALQGVGSNTCLCTKSNIPSNTLFTSAQHNSYNDLVINPIVIKDLSIYNARELCQIIFNGSDCKSFDVYNVDLYSNYSTDNKEYTYNTSPGVFFADETNDTTGTIKILNCGVKSDGWSGLTIYKNYSIIDNFKINNTQFVLSVYGMGNYIKVIGDSKGGVAYIDGTHNVVYVPYDLDMTNSGSYNTIIQ